MKVSLWSATHISSPSSYEILLRLWYESNDVTSPCTELCKQLPSPHWHLLVTVHLYTIMLPARMSTGHAVGALLSICLRKQKLPWRGP